MEEGQAKTVPGSAKPPLGVIPFYVWAEMNPQPTNGQLEQREADVLDAIGRYKGAGRVSRWEWHHEVTMHAKFREYRRACEVLLRSRPNSFEEADTPHVIEQ